MGLPYMSNVQRAWEEDEHIAHCTLYEYIFEEPFLLASAEYYRAESQDLYFPETDDQNEFARNDEDEEMRRASRYIRTLEAVVSEEEERVLRRIHQK